MKAFTDWIEEARYFLMNTDGSENAVFLQRVSVLETSGPLPGAAPAAIGVRANRELTILFCYPLVRHLEPDAAAELLKHEILHYVFGHLSERIRDLRELYGNETVLVAMDLVVNQFCNEKLLAASGFPGVTVEKLGFPTNLTTDQYCKLLQQKDPKTGKSMMERMGVKLSNAFQNVAQAGEQDMDELTKGGSGEATGTGALVEVFANSKDLDPELRDETVVKALQDSRAEAEKTGLARGRGWDAYDAVEFIARVKKPPAVHWQVYVRKFESRHMNVRRVSSRKRPSRRHPSYFGRVKRMGADMMFAIDTSGSMGKLELQMVDPELKAISQRDVHIMVAHVDAGVAKIEEYDFHRGVTQFAGRGGTDFSPLFFELDKLPRIARPSFIVYFTDGYGGCERYLEENPVQSGRRPLAYPGGIETLWLIPEGCTSRDDFLKTVPFGEVVVVPRVVT